MTTTRISHTGHNHPNTTAARTACRKEIREADARIAAYYADKPLADSLATGDLQLATIGNGMRLHYVDMAVMTTRCGKVQPVFTRMGTIADVDCKGCRSKYGQAHG
jgi:hypothetical protein